MSEGVQQVCLQCRRIMSWFGVCGGVVEDLSLVSKNGFGCGLHFLTLCMCLNRGICWRLLFHIVAQYLLGSPFFFVETYLA